MGFKVTLQAILKRDRKNSIMYRFVRLITLIFNEQTVCFETGLKCLKGYFRPFTKLNRTSKLI